MRESITKSTSDYFQMAKTPEMQSMPAKLNKKKDRYPSSDSSSSSSEDNDYKR